MSTNKYATLLLTLLMMVCRRNPFLAHGEAISENSLDFQENSGFSSDCGNVPTVLFSRDGVNSVVQCAVACVSHPGSQDCQLFQFHQETGQCEFLAYGVTGKARSDGTGWKGFQVSDLQEPWVTEEVNGETQYLLSLPESQGDTLSTCLPIMTRVGTLVTITGTHTDDHVVWYVVLSSPSPSNAVSFIVRFNLPAELWLHSRFGFRGFESPFVVNGYFKVILEYETNGFVKVTVNGLSYGSFDSAYPIDAINVYKNGPVILTQIRVQ